MIRLWQSLQDDVVEAKRKSDLRKQLDRVIEDRSVARFYSSLWFGSANKLGKDSYLAAKLMVFSLCCKLAHSLPSLFASFDPVHVGF